MITRLRHRQSTNTNFVSFKDKNTSLNNSASTNINDPKESATTIKSHWLMIDTIITYSKISSPL